MISLRPWSAADRTILDRTTGDAAMMRYLGGAEDALALDRRHEKYLGMVSVRAGEMFVVVLGADGVTAGTVGYWPRVWNDCEIFECGWQVLPAFAGRGIATQAARAVISIARGLRARRYLHAFPSIENIASNRVCEGAGFRNLGECRFEYPKGRFMTCHDWRYDLFSER